MKIKEVIVVEGSHDKNRLQSILNCDVIITGGSRISDATLKQIETLAKTRGIIVFTDPDYNGERIRKIINEKVGNAKNAFLNRKDAQGKKGIGVEYASDKALKEALSKVITNGGAKDSITWEEYLKLEVFNNKYLRYKVGELLNIGTVNNKTFFKRLNIFGITKDELEEKIKLVLKEE
ncbi:MAG TPA: ribonuclease M5 [Tenericutes bacterium]|nr:ribonuclease M5 [Mycoplasmatota bacterium]